MKCPISVGHEKFPFRRSQDNISFPEFLCLPEPTLPKTWMDMLGAKRKKKKGIKAEPQGTPLTKEGASQGPGKHLPLLVGSPGALPLCPFFFSFLLLTCPSRFWGELALEDRGIQEKRCCLGTSGMGTSHDQHL